MSDRPELLNAPANKALGQHFLFDPDILKRTALAAGPVEGRCVVEVGPGPGGLTRALLDQGAKQVVAMEMDERFAEALEVWPEASSMDNRLSVLRGDALTHSLQDIVDRHHLDTPLMIVANLPYNVGTPLLVSWLKSIILVDRMALMFQKEVAQRICAVPGSNHYGRLAVLAQAVARTRIAFTLPPGAFKPPPKVASAVATLERLPETDRFDDLEGLERVTAAAFGQRRKMLRASLKSIMPKCVKAEDLLDSINIDPTRRAETLTQSEFRDLTTAWRQTVP